MRYVHDVMRIGCVLVALTLLAGCVFNPMPITTVTQEEATAALNASKEVLGLPYVWGARGPSEFDCSGLIVWAYRRAIPNMMLRIGERKAYDANMGALWRYNTVMIPPQEVQPGDLVFITSREGKITHGGLFQRWFDGEPKYFEYVNASSYYGAVVIDTWPLQGAKRGQWVVGFGRMKKWPN